MRCYKDNLHLSICASFALGYGLCCYVGCFHSWLRCSMLFGKCVINPSTPNSNSTPKISSVSPPSIFFQILAGISSKIKRGN